MVKLKVCFAALLGLLSLQPAFADGLGDMERLITPQNATASVTEAASASDDAIRVTPDKTRILRLEQDAASVVVTNPEHANVLLDSPRLLIIMPRQPGTTSFTVLNAKGETILEKTIIVTAAAKPNYVRVRRMCNGQDNTCIASAYYYCPDGCYEVHPVQGDQNASQQAPAIVSNSPAPSSSEGGASVSLQPAGSTEAGGGPVVNAPTNAGAQ